MSERLYFHEVTVNLNFRHCAGFKQGFPGHSGKYRV